MHARYTVPAWGRFLSVDSVIDFKRNMTHPQGWNRYAYVRNNPMRATDPDGKSEFRLDNELGREQLAVARGEMTMQEYQDRNTYRAMGALTGLGVVLGGVGIVRAGGAIVDGFQAARLWVAAGAPLAGSSGREMYYSAVARVQSFAGSMTQKADLFQKLTSRIDKVTGGSWSAGRSTAIDGSQVFLRRQVEALIINGEGQVFRAQLGNGLEQTKEGFKILWDLVRPYGSGPVK